MKKKALILAFVSIILIATPSKALAPIAYYIGYSALAHIAAFAGLYIYFNQPQAPIVDPETQQTLYEVTLIDVYQVAGLDPDSGYIDLNGVSSTTVQTDLDYGLMTQSTAESFSSANSQTGTTLIGGGFPGHPTYDTAFRNVVASCQSQSDLIGCYKVANGNTNDGYAGYNVYAVQDISSGTNNLTGAPSSTFTATNGTNSITFYLEYADVPDPINGGTCSDGWQNGDETGVDTGGRCGTGGGDGTCSDGIQNGDETGIDTGGRCATGGSGACIDTNNDGIDDGSGIECTSVSVPGVDNNAYDTAINTPESLSWTGRVTSWMASNPLTQVVSNTRIELSGSECSFTASVFGLSDATIDFCSLSSYFTLFGVLFVGICVLRSFFIAFGVD